MTNGGKRKSRDKGKEAEEGLRRASKYPSCLWKPSWGTFHFSLLSPGASVNPPILLILQAGCTVSSDKISPYVTFQTGYEAKRFDGLTRVPRESQYKGKETQEGLRRAKG